MKGAIEMGFIKFKKIKYVSRRFFSCPPTIRKDSLT